jgi:multidrug efflux pump subunit AcrB
MWNHLRTNPLPGNVKLTQYFLGDPDASNWSLRWGGEMRLTLDVFRDLGAAFGVAILLIYLILVGYYRSFIIPLVVMGAIPLTIVGVFPGHAVMGQYFTATSMIGVIALAGIVVRNSLLLIDFVLEYRKRGHPLDEAVLQAGITRLRPITLTAFAIILGTLVMILDPVFGGLAISLIFGTFASTVLTLFVIPLLYFSVQRSAVVRDPPAEGPDNRASFAS